MKKEYHSPVPNRLQPPPHPHVVYSTDRFKAAVPVLVLLFVALWFILRGLFLFLCFSVLLALRLARLGKRELFLVLFVRSFNLCLFGIVCFLFLLVSRKGCGLCLWYSQDFFLTFFYAPSFEKKLGHIASGLSVLLFVRHAFWCIA